jgi:hypothetical protein
LDLYENFEVPIYTAKEKAAFAIQWITKLGTSAAKQQSAYLGSPAFGYNMFGFGCKLFDLPFFPDETHSPHLPLVVGLHDSKGTFSTPVKYTYKEYGSLEELTRFLSFGRIATWMKRPTNLRVIFKPEVAAILVKHYGGKRTTRHAEEKSKKQVESFINTKTVNLG